MRQAFRRLQYNIKLQHQETNFEQNSRTKQPHRKEILFNFSNMSTVGPTLPPHLQKRKRSSLDGEDPTSPPSKIRVACSPHAFGPAPPPTNPHELSIQDESSGDDYGPSVQEPKPKISSSSNRVLGPAPPPANPDELDLQDDSSEDDCGPSARNEVTSAVKPILGPAPPPANLSEMPSHPPNDSDSSDDDYGPSLPPAPVPPPQISSSNERSVTAKNKCAQKHSPHSDWTSRVDPTKLKNRKFASGKGSKAPAEKSGVSAIWTETPEEKRQRLEDEVLGRKDKSSSSTRKEKGSGDSREDREAEQTARRIRQYNERNRNKTLMDEFQGGAGGGAQEKEDDPSKRGFDREKDMALGEGWAMGRRRR
ncbi:Lipopolysaccharide-specific response 7 [Hyphodiscus hymeniophilus]|uniref:Lipopolysaccharide-specific response 7 n=1 Tax=Hyphodiscus hymeniophilus TaxID=353542 RepID=A0A9P7B005_9HELO|nr:Lipopolysaccharide-specific response 7 [Hyphodiscus hymeniophilus]